MVYVDSTFKTDGLLRPNNDIDPRKKQDDPKYSRDFAKFIYSQFISGKVGITNDMMDAITGNWAFAMARQDWRHYENKFKNISDSDNQGAPPPAPPPGDDSGPNRTGNKLQKSWVNMDFRGIFSPMPKYILNIVGMLMGQEHDVSVHALDEKSQSKKEDRKFKGIAKHYLRDLYQYVEQKLYITKDPDAVEILPRNYEEADMLDKMGNFREPYEIGMNMLVDWVNTMSDQKMIKDSLLRDFVIGNIGATFTYRDPLTSMVDNERVDARDIIIEASADPRCKDVSWVARMRWTTISRLAKDTGLKETELLDLAKKFNGVGGNPATIPMNTDVSASGSSGLSEYRTSDGRLLFDDYRIPELICYWISNDVEYFTERKTADGSIEKFYEPYRRNKDGKAIPPKVYDEEGRKTTRHSMQTIYQAVWPIGTELIYNFGRMHDIPYDYVLSKPELPINIMILPGNSMVYNARTVLHKIMYTYLRMENAIMKVPPPGIKIEWNSMQGMDIGGEEFSALDGITLWSDTGNIVYKLQPNIPGAPPNTGKPIEELRNGLGGYLTELISTMEFYYNQLAEIMGIDRLSSVSKAPTGEQAVKVTELAVAATQNTLRPIYGAYISVKESQSRTSGLMLQGVVQTDHGYKVYSRIVSPPFLDAIRSADTFPPVEWGFLMVARPTEIMKEQVLGAAKAAAGPSPAGGSPALTTSEYIFITQNINTLAGIDYCRLFIQYKETQRDIKDKIFKAQMVKLQTEGAINLEKEKQNTLQVKAKFDVDEKIALMDHQEEIDKVKDKRLHDFKMEEIKALAGVNSDKVQPGQVRENQSKMYQTVE